MEGQGSGAAMRSMRKRRKSSRGGVPADEIPERRQDEHGLRFDLAQGYLSLGVAIAEAETMALQERLFEGGQQRGVDGAKVGEVLKGREFAHVQAVEQAAQVAQAVGRERPFDPGEAASASAEKGNVPPARMVATLRRRAKTSATVRRAVSWTEPGSSRSPPPGPGSDWMTKPCSRKAPMSRRIVRREAPVSAASAATVVRVWRRRLRRMMSWRVAILVIGDRMWHR